MTKRIATITWVSYHNYGTFLQAYALQKYVTSLGYVNAILDDSPIIIQPISWKNKLKKLLLREFKPGYSKYEVAKTQMDKLFDEFKRTMLVIDYDISDLPYVSSKYDTFICGSDQIWSPFFDMPNSDFYYASFTKKKKVAYAPSIGVSEIPLQLRNRFKGLTCDFDFLSAREQEGVDILQELSGKKVAKVVDPTYLLDIKQWELLLPKDSPKEKYILAYFLTPNKTYIATTLRYAKQKGLRLKMFFTDKSYYKYDCDLVIASPVEFLNYIRNAECIFTDSFHGSIFASIFHTQFFTFKRFGQSARNQNSRVENLLRLMGISERLFGEDNCNEVNELPDIDFTYIDANLTPYIEHSKEFLKKALQ